MKKIGIRLLVLTLLIGCSKKAENLENKIEPVSYTHLRFHWKISVYPRPFLSDG